MEANSGSLGPVEGIEAVEASPVDANGCFVCSFLSAQLPVKDPDETHPKKKKRDDAKKVEEVSAAVKSLAKAPRKHQQASFSNAARIREPAKETLSTSSDFPSTRPAHSAVDIEMPEIDEMPCGCTTCLKKETLSLPYKTIPCLSLVKAAGLHLKVINISCLSPSSPSVYILYKSVGGGAGIGSTSWNGKTYMKPALDGISTQKPLIKESTVPESPASEVGKMGRLFCTAEEDVKRGEKVKYQQLLELAKGKYPRSYPAPLPTSFFNIQRYSKEPAVTASALEEPRRGDVYPRATLKTSEYPCDSRLLRFVGRLQIKTGYFLEPRRYYTPAENLNEQGRPVKQAIAGGQYGAEISEGKLFELHLGPILPKKLPALDVEEKKFPSSEKTVEHFSPLTEAMEREVVAAFGRGQPDEIMSSAFKLKVTREDIQTLSNLRWLNDMVINFYMSLLMERSKKEGYPAVHAFSTFFYPKLISGGYKAVKRWSRDVDLFKQDLIFVPVHMRLHWTLVVIDIRKKTIKYFDSMGQKGGKTCETVFQYNLNESRERRNLELTFSEWTLRSMESYEIPQQSNGSDCGVFMCKFADYISRDKPITFTQSHMPYFRKKMVWEIIHQQLL
ncbi:PREDICTED: LOW QUALITY PROTEIN: sentrin-specific protease 2 [Tauraco erythrolophus]|nr:PREDICTED: LOW QUALITY PROTEIN: sentrin-specific protease 2 [Tauraco erythrolophus]